MEAEHRPHPAMLRAHHHFFRQEPLTLVALPVLGKIIMETDFASKASFNLQPSHSEDILLLVSIEYEDSSRCPPGSAASSHKRSAIASSCMLRSFKALRLSSALRTGLTAARTSLTN